MFCERCGRTLKDEEYVCPECGRVCREPPVQDRTPFEGFDPYSGNRPQPVDVKALFFGKYFFIALLIGVAAGMAVSYFWRFTFLLFCIPLFFPMGYKGIGLGLMIGLGIGSLMGIFLKAALLPAPLM